MPSIEYGDFAAIFTGDAEGDTEARAIANFDGAVKATILSGSHHGAATHRSNSPTWAKATAPAVMIYSSGTAYGHPRCSITKNYHGSLATTESHPMHCGIENAYESRNQFDTTKAEYCT